MTHHELKELGADLLTPLVAIFVCLAYLLRKQIPRIIKAANTKNRLGLKLALSVPSIWLCGFLAHIAGLEWTSGALFCLSVLTTFYGLILWSLYLVDAHLELRVLRWPEIARNLTLWLTANAFVAYQLGRHKFIFYWDYSGYWKSSILECREVFQTPLLRFQQLYVSINISDYNAIAPWLLALPMHLIGESFACYVVIVLNMFLLPALFISSILIIRVLRTHTRFAIEPSMAFGVLLLCPYLYYPLLYGYVDCVALLPLSAAMLLASERGDANTSFSKYFALGLLLLGMLLLRRYFVFAAIGLFAAWVANQVLTGFGARHMGWNAFRPFLINLLVVSATCVAIPCLIFPWFVHRSTSSNYVQMYSGYRSGGLLSQLQQTAGYIGPGIILLGALGLWRLFAARKTRESAILILVAAALPIFLFNRVQDLGLHHYYIIALPICVLTGIGIFAPSLPATSSRWTAMLSVGCGMLMVGNFLHTFGSLRSSPVTQWLFTRSVYVPLIRNDISVLEALTKDLAEQSEDGFIYVIAGSETLNDDLLRNVFLPKILVSLKNMRGTAQVDLRDGFPRQFLAANWIVLGDPPQYHLRPAVQQVIGVLVREVQPGGSLAKNFVPFRLYELDGGVKARVLRKVAPFSSEQLQKLREIFGNLYPSATDLFEKRIY